MSRVTWYGAHVNCDMCHLKWDMPQWQPIYRKIWRESLDTNHLYLVIEYRLMPKFSDYLMHSVVQDVESQDIIYQPHSQ